MVVDDYLYETVNRGGYKQFRFIDLHLTTQKKKSAEVV